MKFWTLTLRQLCDLELLLNGGFAPLDGFLTRADYESVLANKRLKNGTLWPMPITLDVSESFAQSLSIGDALTLRSPEGMALATLTISDLWHPDKRIEAEAVFGTTDETHPGIFYLLHEAGPVNVGGKLELIEHPTHYDFLHLRHTPQQLQQIFKDKGWERIVAFQTRNPIHRAHQELTLRAAHLADAALLIHPVVGMTKPGDIESFTRVRCYEHIVKTYPQDLVQLSLLPIAMRMGGPIEALWHAIIRKNYGCTHFIVGRDHAGPGKNKQGQDFYHPYAAQELVAEHATEIGIEMLPFQEIVYIQEKKIYKPVNEVTPDETPLNLSGTALRQALQSGSEIPDWFSFPEIIQELRKTHPPKHQQGLVIFFTGLSGSGKSTLANALLTKLLELGGRRVSLLDGDLVRTHLSSELGFSKEHRDLNIRRIGYVASEIAKHGGIAICAPIAPYQKTRQQVREMVAAVGGFIEVFVATPLEICETRDRKGLYAKARQGLIENFTGISDVYEVPETPEITINTGDVSISGGVAHIWSQLTERGYIN